MPSSNRQARTTQKRKCQHDRQRRHATKPKRTLVGCKRVPLRGTWYPNRSSLSLSLVTMTHPYDSSSIGGTWHPTRSSLSLSLSLARHYDSSVCLIPYWRGRGTPPGPRGHEMPAGEWEVYLQARIHSVLPVSPGGASV